MKVKTTTNYEQFATLYGNRPINRRHVESIKESIRKNGYLPTIAIVNQHKEVVDGQHRLKAVSELGLPYVYTEYDGADVNSALDLNRTQRSWTMQDYIESYANAGNQNYLDLMNDMKKWTISYVPAVTMAGVGTKTVKTGTLKYKSSQQLDERIARALVIQPFIGTKVIALWTAIYKVISNKDYNHQRMMKNLNAHRGSGKLGARIDEKGYILMFEEVYNHHARKTVRFY